VSNAARHNVPIYIPAFTDSELGIDLFTYNRYAAQKGTEKLVFDPFLDVEHYYNRISKAKHLGIFTIGGGVPRNWAQQFGPLGEVLYHESEGKEGCLNRFRYGVRICPEPAHWGGLSGCTYTEGVSWGKFLSKSEGGQFAEVHCDATIAWPILVRGVMERLEKKC